MTVSGSVAAAFWPVAQAFERQLDSSGGGAAVCVYYEGRKVVDTSIEGMSSVGHEIPDLSEPNVDALLEFLKTL